MLVDKGLNDKWVRPDHVRRAGNGRYRIALKETIGRYWAREIVSYPLPKELRGKPIRVTHNGAVVPFQISNLQFSILVEKLQPNEERSYEVELAGRPLETASHIRLTARQAHTIFSNGLIALKLPGNVGGRLQRATVPGPIIAVRRGNGQWLGQGRLESQLPVRSIKARIVEQGPLWTTVEVAYEFKGGYHYRVRLILRPGEDACEVQEESTLPVRLWPAPRPYREIGTLGKSFWDQSREDSARPCLRPSATSNFFFDVGHGLQADRMITHSTASWEIMDVPLRSPTLKTYTAMRPSYPFIDGCWMGVYNSRRNDLLGVAALDIAHWKLPDEMVHPAHRTPGASLEVVLVDSKKDGSRFRFPIENMMRRWLLVATSISEWIDRRAATKRGNQRLEPDPHFPLWEIHTRRGDLRLDKVKDWIVDWPEKNAAHPRVLCRRSDFPTIRKKVRSVPELKACYNKTKQWRAADRYILTGERCGLKAVEAATHAKELLEGILQNGFGGPSYCIGFTRPMRRYALACDVMWDSFTAEEKREARRVCALAAYLMTDGDWWQYAYRPNETTYLPNFNADVVACTGILGLFLHDHPCSKLWVDYSVERMDIELNKHLRRDGGGEENVGSYLMSTWTQLYMPLLWALRHCGVKDYSADPNVLGGARFLLKAFGPPDKRDGGRRMIPPIGHHPHTRKAFPMFAWLAAFIKKSDPKTASHLMWMWRACGAPAQNLYDHFGPTANPLTRHFIMHDPTIPEVEPRLRSYNLPHVGAVLRSHDASGKGSYLFFKAGRVHSHHDPDEGSFHYFGRGVPLVLDGLPLQNGATAEQHNQVSFSKPGQPTMLVERFATSPLADYVRGIVAPRGYCCDANYVDGDHRSSWERQLLLVKADEPGGVEYLVVKDVCGGPESCQWNLDVLSRKPVLKAANHIWFPGHKEFHMGLEVFLVEPSQAKIQIEKGIVNPDLLSARRRVKLPEQNVRWPIVEHWLMHVPAPAGSAFVAVLFPRRPNEAPPAVAYAEREETISISHPEGRDLVFLRSNPMVGTNLDGVRFRGRAGVCRERKGSRSVHPLDAEHMEQVRDGKLPYRLL